MNIFLIRHGEKQQFAGNPPLTDLGWRQAQASADYFSEVPLQKILASPLLRTQQTAQVISEQVNLPITTDRRLFERANCDEDMPFDLFLEYWRHASKDRNYQPPVGDSSYQAGLRVEQVVAELELTPDTETVLFVTHGGTITDFLRNISTDKYLLDNYYQTLEQLYDTSVPECAITQVKKSQAGYEIIDLCSTEHLQGIV